MNPKANPWRPYWSQFAQFAFVGCAATALQYLVLVLLVQGFQVSAQCASAVGFGCGAALSYLLNRQWTFQSTGPHARLVVRFALMVAAGFCLNSALMYSGIRMLGLYYLFAQCIATAVTLAMNFLVARIWVFRG
jgi:putative flippase GtrA